MIEPLPEELQHLVAGEANAPVTNAAGQAAVRAKLGATLGIAKTGSAGAAGGAAVKAGISIKLIAVVGAGVIALGAGIGIAVTRTGDRVPRASVTTPSPAERSVPTRASAPAPAIAVEPLAEEAPPSVPAKPPARTRHVTAPVPPPPSPNQSQLLADASRALALGDPTQALGLIDQDMLHHPTGPLSEERVALRVSALTALGRTDDARQAARELLATYPQTIHRRLAEHVLAKETP